MIKTDMIKTSMFRTATGIALLALVISLSASAAISCESLTALVIPNATVTSATPVTAGAQIPGVGRGRGAVLKLPAFCRVAVVSKPIADSEIHFEVWLPAAESWNGKFEGTTSPPTVQPQNRRHCGRFSPALTALIVLTSLLSQIILYNA